MPTVFVLLVAAWTADLRLTAELVGLRVRATLHNDGAQAVTVTVGDKCAGAAPFALVVDGKERPFAGEGATCAEPKPITRSVAAGGVYVVMSDSLDGRKHTVVPRYANLAAAPLQVPTDVRVDLSLAATTHARAGRAIDLELTHVNRSPEPTPLGSCGEDRLLVDGKEQPWPATVACVPVVRDVAVRGAWVTRGRLTLPAGRHLVRARWRDSQSNDVAVDVAP